MRRHFSYKRLNIPVIDFVAPHCTFFPTCLKVVDMDSDMDSKLDLCIQYEALVVIYIAA